MGHISKDLQNIPDGYQNYLVILPSTLENDAQRIIDSEFIHLSKAVGRNTLIIYFYGDEENRELIDELQLQGKKFPMLFYLDKRPTKESLLNDGEGCISFELGEFRDRHSLFVFLEKICWYMRSSNAREKVEWHQRKETLLKILKTLSKGLPYVRDVF